MNKPLTKSELQMIQDILTELEDDLTMNDDEKIHARHTLSEIVEAKPAGFLGHDNLDLIMVKPTEDDILFRLGKMVKVCFREGDYDPEEDRIQDEEYRNLAKLLNDAIRTIAKLRSPE